MCCHVSHNIWDISYFPLSPFSAGVKRTSTGRSAPFPVGCPVVSCKHGGRPPGVSRKIKSPYPIQLNCRDKSCNPYKYSCGATRLDVIYYIHSCILTYAFFDNGVSSPARLLQISTRPQKPIHSKSGIPRSHRPQLSVKRPLKLLALPHRSGNTLSL